DELDIVWLGQKSRVVNVVHRAVGHGHCVNDAGIGGDDVHVVLAAEPFLDNLEVEQTEEPATETEAKGNRAFGLGKKGGVVELKLGEIGFEMLVIGGV